MAEGQEDVGAGQGVLRHQGRVAVRRLHQRDSTMAAHMIRRSLRSAAYAASLLAADVVLLVLYLNPRVTLGGDGGALALVLFLPYAVAGTLALWAMALLARAVIGWPRAPRPPLHNLPWFTAMSTLAASAAAALFWFNLVSYRHSLPLE